MKAVWAKTAQEVPRSKRNTYAACRLADTLLFIDRLGLLRGGMCGLQSLAGKRLLGTDSLRAERLVEVLQIGEEFLRDPALL